MFNEECNSILLGYRSSNAQWNPNTWCPFGGTIEEGELPIETAIREYYEETGISVDSYDITQTPIYTKTDTDSYGHLHQMFLYLGMLHTEIDPVINDEHTDYKWVLLTDLFNMNLHPIILDVLSCNKSVELIKSFLLAY